jgi:voltage-gated potassium channel
LVSYLEDIAISDSFWLSLTTITTVGYGDISASTDLGRLATVILLYGGGIFLLAKLSGDFFEIKSDKIRKKQLGKWKMKMENHIVVIGGDANNHRSESYLLKLLKVLSKSKNTKNLKIAILSGSFPEGLSSKFENYKNVILFSDDPWVWSSIKAASIESAKIVIINSPETNNVRSDSLIFDTISKIRDLNDSCFILSEVVDPENKSRFLKIGSDIVMRPSRSFPEIMVRAIETPGSEKIIEYFLTAENDSYSKVDFNRPIELVWKDVVLFLLEENYGLPVGYSLNGEITTNPLANEKVKMDILYIMADIKQNINEVQIENELIVLSN